MRGRWMGLLFAAAVCCLMCLPFIVSTDAEPARPETPPKAYQETALVLADSTAYRIIHTKKTDSGRIAPERTDGEALSVPSPVSDANGLPVLRTSYIRSNYQAFSLTGNGG